MVSKTAGFVTMMLVLLFALVAGKSLGMTDVELAKNIISDLGTATFTIILFSYLLQRRKGDN